jgi:hypothetical protein
MAVIAWILIVLSLFHVVFVFHSAMSGGPNPQPVNGSVLLGHIFGVVAQVAVCGRVLGWW